MGLMGGVMLVACATLYVLGGQSKGQAYLAYLFLFGVAPLLAASLLLVAPRQGRLTVRLETAVRLFLGLVLAGALLLGGAEYVNGRELSTRGPFFAVVFGSVLTAAILCRPRRHPRRLSLLNDPARRPAVLERFDALLIGLLVAVTIFFGRFYPAGHPGVPLASDLVIYAWETPHFAAWLGFGLVFTVATIWLWRLQDRKSDRTKRWLDRLALLGAIPIVLGLFDDGLYVNVQHYMVHVGPAMHAFHGGVAMVDTYSIYGLLPWVVVEMGFRLLGPTFGTAALIVRVSQVLTLLAMVLVLYAVSRRRLAALSLMVPGLLVAVTFHPGLVNLNILPSTSGLRYLPPSLMVLVLTAVPSPAWSRWLGVAVLMVAALWSVETFLYTLAPWGYVLLLQAVRERSLRRAGLTLLLGLASVALAHVGFALGTFLMTGQTVDYEPYFGQVMGFRPYVDRGMLQVPLNPNFGVWLPIWLGHFLVLSTAAYRALQARAPTDMASRLVPVAAYGFIALNYFMIGPSWPSLGLAFLPVAIELICVLEVLSAKSRKYGTIGVAALVALVAVSSMMVAFGSERFARPMVAYQATSTVLRRCFTVEGCRFAEIPGRLKRGIAATPLDPEGPFSVDLHQTDLFQAPRPVPEANGIAWQSITEAVDILRRWAPNQPRVALLADQEPYNWFIGLAVMMETGQWYRWPISSPGNDQISESLVRLTLRRVAADPMRNGEILVVSNDREYWLFLEQKIFADIAGQCHFALVEKRQFHSVYRMEACRPAPAPAR